MKHRAGFVSNSSSSSFIVFGKAIKPSDVVAEDLKKKNIRILGKDLSEGMDFIHVADLEMLKYAKENEELARRPWFCVSAMLDADHYAENEMIEIPSDINPGDGVTTIDVDYHSSDDLENLKMRYDVD